jgi:hypothetical protein
LSFGTSGIGGTSHLASEMLMAMAGISMLHVPYRGGGPAAQALLAGETKVTFIDLITALPFIANGQVRALGTSTAAVPRSRRMCRPSRRPDCLASTARPISPSWPRPARRPRWSANSTPPPPRRCARRR